MREIVFDTETTGLDPKQGERLIEIGCVELLNRIPSGKTFHVYVNPDREVSAGAFEVHGLSNDFLADKPRFTEVAQGFIDFVEDGKLVAHNASFDMRFINMELERDGREAIPGHQVIDTLDLARRKHPGAQNSLDALCSRYGIDNSSRTKHGALLDAELLADVYIELLGGKQAGFDLSPGGSRVVRGLRKAPVQQRPSPLAPRLTDAEREKHAAFVETLGENALWKRFS